MFHPSGLRKFLFELFLRRADDLPVVVENNSSGTGGALVKRKDVWQRCLRRNFIRSVASTRETAEFTAFLLPPHTASPILAITSIRLLGVSSEKGPAMPNYLRPAICVLLPFIPNALQACNAANGSPFN